MNILHIKYVKTYNIMSYLLRAIARYLGNTICSQNSNNLKLSVYISSENNSLLKISLAFPTFFRLKIFYEV